MSLSDRDGLTKFGVDGRKMRRNSNIYCNTSGLLKPLNWTVEFYMNLFRLKGISISILKYIFVQIEMIFHLMQNLNECACSNRTYFKSLVTFSFLSVYVIANLRNQIFPGIPNPLRESWESLKWISSKSNLT